MYISTSTFLFLSMLVRILVLIYLYIYTHTYMITHIRDRTAWAIGSGASRGGAIPNKLAGQTSHKEAPNDPRRWPPCCSVPV